MSFKNLVVALSLVPLVPAVRAGDLESEAQQAEAGLAQAAQLAREAARVARSKTKDCGEAAGRQATAELVAGILGSINRSMALRSMALQCRGGASIASSCLETRANYDAVRLETGISGVLEPLKQLIRAGKLDTAKQLVESLKSTSGYKNIPYKGWYYLAAEVNPRLDVVLSLLDEKGAPKIQKQVP